VAHVVNRLLAGEIGFRPSSIAIDEEASRHGRHLYA
jgi:hypothetical protein